MIFWYPCSGQSANRLVFPSGRTFGIFLKGVVPEWDLKDIYGGMMQFMVIQVFGLIMIMIFPQIVLWLPELIYGK